MKPVSYKVVIRVLEERGFAFVRQRGSHLKYRKMAPVGRVTVIVPRHAAIRAGTLRAIAKQSGITIAEFEQ